ncbi:MAG: deoxyhypusine synthase [Candidatus Thermoplasmatota archaeon]|nr:deoxyhypusine synthase [Candidatus Thermoplasmatota archaeon]MCL5790486.1 deoxyhypusine synthase [Candidatus Thermoplasmatota archaeon]
MNKKDLLSTPVRDTVVNEKTSMMDFMKMMEVSGGFTTSKVYVAYEILRDMFREENTTFLSFPADIISTGTRGVINQLVKEKLVDVIITTTGTLDHDIARTFRDYYCGSFDYPDRELKDLGINRLGSVVIPDESYGEIMESFMQPELEKLYSEKKTWATWEIIQRIGLKLNSEDSILYNAAKNGIKVFVPGITDGSFGSQLWSFREMNHDFMVDVLADEHELSDIIFDAKKTGSLMIGGGISKHHTIWWNQFRGGLDYSVYITTAQEYDGSLSGAKLEEAISWKKVKPDARFVNVYGDVTLILPVMVGPLL